MKSNNINAVSIFMDFKCAVQKHYGIYLPNANPVEVQNLVLAKIAESGIIANMCMNDALTTMNHTYFGVVDPIEYKFVSTHVVLFLGRLYALPEMEEYVLTNPTFPKPPSLFVRFLNVFRALP